MAKIKADDRVYIIYDKRRQWIRTIAPNQKFHSDKGYLEYNQIIGQPYGTTTLLQPQKNKVALVKPTFADIIFHMKRQSQIIYPEDIGLILMYSGIQPGCCILEAGSGSGTVSSIMGIYSQPGGKVHSFDIRKIAIEQARKNVRQMGMEKHVFIEFGDILNETLPYTDQDFIMLDLATTWDAVSKITPYLKSTGRVCLFSPTLEQVRKNQLALQEHEFFNIFTVEQIKRTFQVKPNATRPSGRMVGHTGYLTFGSLHQEPLLSHEFTDLYSASNIGNLLIYGDVRPDHHNLIIHYDGSPLPKIVKQKFGAHSDALKVLKINPNLSGDELSDLLKQYVGNYQVDSNSAEILQFHSILIDQVYHPSLIDHLEPLLTPSGVFSALSASIEHMKSINDQMYLKNYFKVASSELICRKILYNPSTNTTTNEWLPQCGYLTFGRKVRDTVGQISRKPKNPEFVEPVLEVGVKFAQETEPEPEKIDYANLREEENT